MDDLSEHLRTPMGAALAAAAMTSGYIYMKHRLNNEPKPEMHAYTKPAALNALMVYFIVANGGGTREQISSDPF